MISMCVRARMQMANIGPLSLIECLELIPSLEENSYGERLRAHWQAAASERDSAQASEEASALLKLLKALDAARGAGSPLAVVGYGHN